MASVKMCKFWHDIWAVSDELNEQLMAIFTAKMTSQPKKNLGWALSIDDIYHSTASEGAHLISLKLCSLPGWWSWNFWQFPYPKCFPL